MAGSFDRAAILESFLKELNAYVPEIEANLDRAQRQPQNTEALEEIYRRVHTIAGSAGMMELSGMAQIATAMETVVGDVLDGVTPLTDQIVGLLHRSVQRLRQLMELARVGADDSALVAQDKQDHAVSRPRVSGNTGQTPRVFGGPGVSNTTPPPGVAPQQQTPPLPQPVPQTTPPMPMPSWIDQRAAPPPPPLQSPVPPATAWPPVARGPALTGEAVPTTPLQDLPFGQSSVGPAPPPPLAGPAQAPAALTRLADTPLWRDVQADEESIRACASALVQSIGALRELSRAFDGERGELQTFLDGSKDALDRLEQWAGQAMGIDLRTSPDHVRRYLPLSVLWVVTTRMKAVQDKLHEATRGLTVQQESLGEVLGHLGAALDRAGQLAGSVFAAAAATPDGGFTASVSQFAYVPPATRLPADLASLRPAERAELERAVREELRREIEDDVRSDVAAEVRRDEERRLRQELEIQVRRQLLAELSPSMGVGASLAAGMDLGLLAASARPAAPAQPHRVVVSDRASETLEVFRSEAEEHLRTISNGVTALEQRPSDADAIRSIRRAVHTLKGAAAITGFNTVADLAHICEDLLDRMGDGSIATTPEIISLLLDTSQALEALINGDTAEQGGEAGMVAALRPRYQVLLGETVELATPTPQPKVDASAASRGAMRVTEEQPDDDIELDAGAEARAAAERAGASDLSVRLPLRKLDELISLFGDILVNRSVVEERMSRLSRMISENGSVSEHLREVGTKIERQYEASMLPSQRNAPPPGQGFAGRPAHPPSFGGVMSGPNATPQAEFDPLELDRYSEFHQLSRGLSEGITDATALGTEMETTVREMEVALAREARLSSLFQDALLKARLVPISSLMPRLYRAVRAISVKYGKEFEMFIDGEDTEVDRSVYEDIAAPLLHLVRNAIYHGIETPATRAAAGKSAAGKIIISARYEGNQLFIAVRDDGSGINPSNIRSTAIARGLIDAYTQLSDREVINLIFQPGFSTSETVTEEAGRGIGLDVVRDTVTKLRGTIEVDSLIGQGSTFTMKIPISLQIQRVVLVRAGEQVYAIPMSVVEQLVQLDFFPRGLMADGGQALEVRGERYRLAHLSPYLNVAPGPVGDKTPVLLIAAGNRRWGLLVDAMSGRQEEIVAKNLGPHLRNVPGISGATVLGNGQVVLILDPVETLQRPPRSGAALPILPPPGATLPQLTPPTDPARRNEQPMRAGSGVSHGARSAPQMPPGARSTPYILVVDDSPSVRRVVSTTLKNAGWEVLTARDGLEALEIVAQRPPAAILLDIEMPRMDGYELMSALRSQPMYQQLPLIVLTSRAATKHQQRALQLGADAYVVKPYQDEQLLGTVNELVAIRPTGEAR